MRTSNPALSDSTFQIYKHASLSGRTMTLQGTVNKCAFLLFLVFLTGMLSWHKVMSGEFAQIMPVGIGCGVASLIVAVVLVFRHSWAVFLAPVYAMAKGVTLGILSAFFETRYPGIVIQAVGLTLGVLCALLMAYSSRVIKPSENFKLGVAAATGGIFVMYLASMALGVFGIYIPFIHDSGPIGIGISAFIVVVAAMNLVLDFDFIENGVEQGAPRFMEWYAAFGLLVTLVWLYVEILRLLSKLRSR